MPTSPVNYKKYDKLLHDPRYGRYYVKPNCLRSLKICKHAMPSLHKFLFKNKIKNFSPFTHIVIRTAKNRYDMRSMNFFVLFILSSVMRD